MDLEARLVQAQERIKVLYVNEWNAKHRCAICGCPFCEHFAANQDDREADLIEAREQVEARLARLTRAAQDVVNDSYSVDPGAAIAEVSRGVLDALTAQLDQEPTT
ncbi:MAG TPA: hypothetical protein VJB57_11675 [Dehalococcoidia bacterium]|nr:hypothetical protein [Dehalococcoidia bacterium]